MNAESRVPDASGLVTAGRAQCYRLLGAAFAYPIEDLFGALADGTFSAVLTEAVRHAAPALVGPLQEQSADLTLPDGATLDSLEADYLATFELNMPKRATSLYEGSYAVGSDRSAILLEVKSFYQHFGLAIPDDLREPEDHLAAELEFMHFLAIKQALAERDGEDATPYRHAQRDFLQRHLADWLPAYGAAAQHIESAFYRTLSWLAVAFVGADQEAARVQDVEKGRVS